MSNDVGHGAGNCACMHHSISSNTGRQQPTKQVYTLLCIASVYTSNTVYCISVIQERRLSISASTCAVRTTTAPHCAHWSSTVEYKATASSPPFHYIAHTTTPSPLQLPCALTILLFPSLYRLSQNTYARIQHLPSVSIHQPEKHPPLPKIPKAPRAARLPSWLTWLTWLTGTNELLCFIRGRRRKISPISTNLPQSPHTHLSTRDHKPMPLMLVAVHACLDPMSHARCEAIVVLILNCHGERVWSH